MRIKTLYGWILSVCKLSISRLHIKNNSVSKESLKSPQRNSSKNSIKARNSSVEINEKNALNAECVDVKNNPNGPPDYWLEMVGAASPELLLGRGWRDFDSDKAINHSLEYPPKEPSDNEKSQGFVKDENAEIFISEKHENDIPEHLSMDRDIREKASDSYTLMPDLKGGNSCRRESGALERSLNRHIPGESINKPHTLEPLISPYSGREINKVSGDSSGLCDEFEKNRFHSASNSNSANNNSRHEKMLAPPVFQFDNYESSESALVDNRGPNKSQKSKDILGKKKWPKWVDVERRLNNQQEVRFDSVACLQKTPLPRKHETVFQRESSKSSISNEHNDVNALRFPNLLSNNKRETHIKYKVNTSELHENWPALISQREVDASQLNGNLYYKEALHLRKIREEQSCGLWSV